MVNQKKIRTMSRIAMLEKQNTEQIQSAKEYYRSDYISVHMMKNAFRLTIVFLLLFLLWSVYHEQWLIEKFNTMQIKGFLMGISLLYLVWIGICMIFTYLMAMRRYFYQQKLLRYYQNLLQKLEEEEDIEVLEVRNSRRKE